EGIRQDYAALFGVQSEGAADEFVRLASLNKRAANQYLCPCGSNRRLGKCHHRQVNRLRARLGRSWFRAQMHGVPDCRSLAACYFWAAFLYCSRRSLRLLSFSKGVPLANVMARCCASIALATAPLAK